MPSSLSAFKELRVGGRHPSLPAGLRIYAVGDIHGRSDLLDTLLARIETDKALRPTARSLYVFLGDYIDRGSSSRETIDRLISHGETHEAVFLKGNHELLAIKGLSDSNLFDQWIRLGGLETLKSYGAAAPETSASGNQIIELQSAFHMRCHAAHFRFFRSLQQLVCVRRLFLCSCRRETFYRLSHQNENDLLWIRGEFLSATTILARSSFTDIRLASEIEMDPQPDQHRYRGLCDRSPDLPGA